MKIDFTLNGLLVSVNVDPRESLLRVLREYLNLRGTKFGCGEGECGACTVLVNGKPITSCLVLVGQVHGANVVTIEGMEADSVGKHIVSAFIELGSIQCGFCTPGMIISARALLSQNPTPTVTEIKFALGGNLCRCTGYKKIIEAVLAAGEKVVAEKIRVKKCQDEYRVIRSAGYVRPESLGEAIDLLSNGSDWQIVSGCTDVGVRNLYHLKEKNILDLGGLSEIKGISEDENYVHIGGGTTFTEIWQSLLLRKWAKPLVQAAEQIGAVQIQNRGTLAGNLVNASPAADSVPPLFVVDASVVLRSNRGERLISINQFTSRPGETVIAPDEVLTEVLVPKKLSEGEEITFFAKYGPRHSQSISIVSVAFRGWLIKGRFQEVVVALGAVAPTAILALHTAEYLTEGKLTEDRVIEAGKLAAEASRPIDDIRATAAYRRHLVKGLIVRNLWQYTQMTN